MTLAELTNKPVIDLKDTRLLRVKTVRFAVPFLAAMCQLPEGQGLRINGWPEGAVVVSMRPYQAPSPVGMEMGVEFALHHPSFPIVRDGDPPSFINLTAEMVGGVIHDTEAGC